MTIPEFIEQLKTKYQMHHTTSLQYLLKDIRYQKA